MLSNRGCGTGERNRPHQPHPQPGGAQSGSGIVLGIGCDCAIFRQRSGTEDLVFTTDMPIEGVHFGGATHRAEDAGWKALARGLSTTMLLSRRPA